MSQSSIQLIEALTNANGAPGFEDEVLEIIREQVPDSVCIDEDKIRNLYLRNKKQNDTKPIVMVEAHSDELGFMVQFMTENGMIKFLPLGGWHHQAMMGHKFRVRTAHGDYIPGVIASKPPHFMTDKERTDGLAMSEMVIDVGATSLVELREDFKIELGAPIIPDVNFSYNSKKEIMLAKAFDNRIGCAAVVESITDFIPEKHEVGLVGVISSQEEVGLRGAKVATANIRPAAAIVFEGTPADDTYNSLSEAQGAMKKGPQLRHRDRSMISNPRFVKFAQKIAQRENITYQDAVRASGGTDGGEIHLTGRGVPTIVIGVPTRYAHTHHCFCALSDYKAALKWCNAILKNLNQKVLDGF